jgi:phosphonate transport system substrate-binding protein
MNSRLSRRLFLFQLFFLAACGSRSLQNQGEVIIIGTVSYYEGQQTLNQYDRLINYLGEKTQSLVRLEPAFNENKALERIRNRSWTLVFAPPGLAALAISQQQYRPLFPLEGVQNLRSIFVVLENSPIRELKELANKTVALGQPGSATGFYLPIYNLYGLTLAEILLAPTPKAILSLVAEGKADAGALSQREFNFYKSQFPQIPFRVLYNDPHNVPLGSVLISPTIERNRQAFIQQVLSEAASVLAQETGYVPTASIPDYRYMIAVVERVRSIFPYELQPGSAQLKPARLFKG